MVMSTKYLGWYVRGPPRPSDCLGRHQDRNHGTNLVVPDGHNEPADRYLF